MRTTNRCCTVLIAGSFALIVCTSALAYTPATPPPCRASPQWGAFGLRYLRGIWHSYGFDSSTIAMATDSATCQAAINAFNTGQPDSLRIDSGYVYSGTHEYMLVIAPGTAPLYTRTFIIYYDRSFRELSRQ